MQGQEGRINIDVEQIFFGEQELINIEQQPSLERSALPLSLQEHLASIELEDTKDLSLFHNPKNNLTNSFISAQEQIMNLTKMIKSKEVSLKKLPIVDTAKITNKLHEQKKHSCARMFRSHITPKTQQKSHIDNKLGKYPNIHKVHHSPTIKSQSGVHERLYNMSRSVKLKETYFTNPAILVKQKSKSNSNSQRYLKNYVPFEKRLEEYLNHSQLTANKCLVKDNSQRLFRPQLIQSKYSGKIQSRYRKGEARELQAREIAQFLNSSVESSESNESVSAKIASKIEQHFLSKMRLIFVSSPWEQIKINEDIISLLTEVQFQVLQPFIMQIQNEGLKGIHFDDKIKQFYKSLRNKQKQRLKSHQANKKGKYLQLKQQLRKKKKSPLKQIPKIQVKKKRSTLYKGDYHRTIQTFV